jgi:hypothetical protein
MIHYWNNRATALTLRHPNSAHFSRTNELLLIMGGFMGKAFMCLI